MTGQNFALAVRPGEHACCRLAHADDRERIAVAFVRDGLARGHKVVYLCDSDRDAFVAQLAARDTQIEPALERGQLDVREAVAFCCEDGAFDADVMLDRWRAEHARALVDGYAALSLTGEMTWALRGVPGAEHVADYERRLPEVMAGDGSLAFLCQYDHGRFAAGTLAEAAEAHQVDVSPELAAIGREGCLAAARVNPGSTLRLAGELDFGCSQTLAAVLDAHYHGDLRLDLADLRFVDVAGMRALRGRKGQRLEIVAASAGVRQLLDLLAWDTDPDIELADTMVA